MPSLHLRFVLQFSVLLGVVALSCTPRPALAQRGWRPNRILPGVGPMVFDTEQSRVLMDDLRYTWSLQSDGEWSIITQSPVTGRFGRDTIATNPEDIGLVSHRSNDTVVMMMSGAYGPRFFILDGDTWSPGPQPPNPEHSTKLAHHTAAGHTIFYFVLRGVGTTTIWDGESWAVQEQSDGPSVSWYGPKEMAYDPGREEIVLFGTGPDSNETWIWDGQTWTLRNSDGPEDLFRPVLVYDPTIDQVILFAGETFVDYPRVPNPYTWAWDGTAWAQLDRTPTPIPDGGFIAPDHAANRIHARFAGPYDIPQSWVFDAELEWHTESPVFVPRVIDSALAHDPVPGQTLMFSGRTLLSNSYIPPATTWVSRGDRWQAVTSKGPPGRWGHAMAYDAAREEIILYGGRGAINISKAAPDTRTWAWDGSAWSVRATEGPGFRTDFAMAYDEARQQIVLHSGSSEGGIKDQTWLWDGNDWTLTEAIGPGARRTHAMAYDPVNREVILYGGSSDRNTWAWDGQSWNLRATTGPTARYNVAMEYDRALGRLVLYGGLNNAILLRETWAWDGQRWTLLDNQLENPSNAINHAITYDHAVGQLVMVTERSDSVWKLNPQGWTRRQPSAPRVYPLSVPRYLDSNDGLEQATYDHVAGHHLMLLRDETWAFEQGEWILKSFGPLPIDPRYGLRPAQLVTDPSAGRPALFGDRQAIAWDGDEWDLLYQNEPAAPRLAPVMIPDQSGSRVLAVTTTTGGAKVSTIHAWDGADWSILDDADDVPRDLNHIAPLGNGQLLTLSLEQRPNPQSEGSIYSMITHRRTPIGWIQETEFGDKPRNTFGNRCDLDSPLRLDPATGLVTLFNYDESYAWFDGAWRRLSTQFSYTHRPKLGSVYLDPEVNRLATVRDGVIWRWHPGCSLADFDADDVLTINDISEFIRLFLAGDKATDLNLDNILDLADLQAFVTAFLAGC